MCARARACALGTESATQSRAEGTEEGLASGFGTEPLPPLPSSFQLTVEMFDYLECELNLFQTGESLPPIWPRLSWELPNSKLYSRLGPAVLAPFSLQGWAAQARRRQCPYPIPPPPPPVLVPGVGRGRSSVGASRVGDCILSGTTRLPTLQASQSPEAGLTSLITFGR